MNFASVKKIVIPEGVVKKIECNGVVLWKSFTNLVPTSIDTDGSIYNGGLGYKNGYRIRSSGAEGTATNGACTGFIPLKANDVVRLSGYDANYNTTANAINVYDAKFSNLGQVTPTFPTSGYNLFGTYKEYGWHSVVENPNGVYVWTVPPVTDIAYMRVSGYTTDGSKMIVTVNEEIS